MSVAEQARGYIRRGWATVPVGYREKRPSCGKGWEALRLTEDDVDKHFNRGATNIGVILGPPSNGLVDIDLDCPEALMLARAILPKTELRFGRASTPDSHWLYVSPGSEHETFTDPVTNKTLVELRTRGKSGGDHQTVFPPSVHESGEDIEWSSYGDPLEIMGDQLRESVAQLAAISLMAIYWPEEGGRQEFSMRVAGVLARGGVPVDKADRIIGLIASAAGDDEWDMRQIANITQRRIDNDEPTYGYTGLCEVIDERVASRFTQWLKITPTEVQSHDDVDATQDFIALSFIDHHQARFNFCHEHGCWFIWDGSIWRRDVKRAAIEAVRDWCRDLADRMPRARAALGRLNTISAVENLMRTDQRVAVTAEVWDADPFLLGTPAGTVDLRTGALRVSASENRITKSTAVAPDQTDDCPLWDKFLDETTQGDAELKRYLRAVAGYAATGSTREHALFFVHGPGGNGKSVFVSTISRILGDYSTTAMMETFVAARGERHPTELASLRGARLVTASETEEGRRWAESRIKALTGGEAISARFMRQDAFEFTPQLKLLISGNHAPNLVNVDEAMRRRLHVIPFTNTPSAPDKELEQKLEGEWPGILRWMVLGAVDWIQNGLKKPEIVSAATDNYFSEQNVFAHWLEQHCRVEPNNTHLFSTSRELFESWQSFAEANGENAGSSKGLSSRLARIGLRNERRRLGTVTRGWVGIALLSAENYSATEF